MLARAFPGACAVRGPVTGPPHKGLGAYSSFPRPSPSRPTRQKRRGGTGRPGERSQTTPLGFYTIVVKEKIEPACVICKYHIWFESPSAQCTQARVDSNKQFVTRRRPCGGMCASTDDLAPRVHTQTCCVETRWPRANTASIVYVLQPPRIPKEAQSPFLVA